MGNSTVSDLFIDSTNLIENNVQSESSKSIQKLLLIEKCRFLETSGCVQTCLHACKIPTQNFFFEEMGLPVYIKPNITDYSCRFEFGIFPIPIESDLSLKKVSCLLNCKNDKNIKNIVD
jgi:hypothetical protein